jgi:hypothetical protein
MTRTFHLSLPLAELARHLNQAIKERQRCKQ